MVTDSKLLSNISKKDEQDYLAAGSHDFQGNKSPNLQGENNTFDGR